MSTEQYFTFAINGFSGINQNLILGQAPTYTRNLDNVETVFGKIVSRGGTSKFRSITLVSATTPIIALMQHTASLGSAATLYRHTLTKVQRLNTTTNVWDDATGTDLTGATTDKTQWVNHKGVLVFTNGGADRPRKLTASGNSATLGGTPPFGKVLADYFGFLFLGNISSDGITFNPREIRYTDDFDNDWALCDGNTITLNETSGEILAMLPLGRTLLVYKADAIETINFVGGPIRFKQDVLPFGKGIIAPLSVARMGQAGHIFLASDIELYQVTHGQINPLAPKVQDKLQTTMDITKAQQVFTVIVPDKETAFIFYPTSSSDTFSRGRISYNWRTGDMAHATFAGHEFTSGLGFKFNQTSNVQIIGATNDLVFELDTTDGRDDGTFVNRFYDTDWQNFKQDNAKYLREVILVFTRKPKVRVRISIASNFVSKFNFEQEFSLRGITGESLTTISYRPPQPFFGASFNVRLKFFHDSTNAAELKTIMFKWTPSEETVKLGKRTIN